VAQLEIRCVEKSFGDVQVLKGIDLSIRSGEFFTLLGPSGCGKTTLLRIIAGFQPQNAGTIELAGERLDVRPAHRRDVGMVFQDYALFPHLNVAENVAFGMRARKLPKTMIDERVAEGLRMVRLDGLGDRMPAELSGGQQQRVGLARAMAIRPKLLLMDEPLSNLDAKLRTGLREDIRDIQKRLGITTVYVTHDQEEALAISDRICVMNAGRVEQIGTPYEIYREPARRFAASFVGTMNFLPSTAEAGSVRVGGRRLAVACADGPVDIAIRPENVHLAPAAGDGKHAIVVPGDVEKVIFLGREAHYVVATELGQIVAQVAEPGPDALSLAGSRVSVALPHDRIVAFDGNGDRRAVGLEMADTAP
jgi:ABC-type Fe3+/spermidine/putrescine transport system ATPase subunit